MAGERLQCCVPFCGRSRGDRKGDPVDRYDEWICGDHWKLVSRRTKLFRRRCDAALEKARREAAVYRSRQGYVTHIDLVLKINHAGRRAARAWDRCKREAIEKGMGIRS